MTFRHASAGPGIGIGNRPAVADAADRASLDDPGERLAETFVADAESGPPVGAGEGRDGEGREHGLLKAVDITDGDLCSGLALRRDDDVEPPVVS